MFFKITFTFIYISLSSFVLGNDSESPLCDLINSGTPPYETNSPINVDTTNAQFVRGPPLVIRNALIPPLVVKNNGYNLEVLGNPVAPDTAAIYGGVLCNQSFIFHKADFVVNPKLGRSFHTIDGRGTPLTARLTYFNVKYGSFEESLKHPNGVVIADFLMDFALKPNLLFYPVEFVLFFLLHKPGAQIPLPASLIYAWFDRLPFIHEYYAFFGSYTDLKTGKQYQPVINIVAKKIVYTLSELQFFFSFASLQGANGKKQDSTQPLNPTNGRTIYEGQEIGQQIVLF